METRLTPGWLIHPNAAYWSQSCREEDAAQRLQVTASSLPSGIFSQWWHQQSLWISTFKTPLNPPPSSADTQLSADIKGASPASQTCTVIGVSSRQGPSTSISPMADGDASKSLTCSSSITFLCLSRQLGGVSIISPTDSRVSRLLMCSLLKLHVWWTSFLSALRQSKSSNGHTW